MAYNTQGFTVAPEGVSAPLPAVVEFKSSEQGYSLPKLGSAWSDPILTAGGFNSVPCGGLIWYDSSNQTLAYCNGATRLLVQVNPL